MYESSEKQTYVVGGLPITLKPVSASLMTITFSGNYQISKDSEKIVKLKVLTEEFKLGETIKISTNKTNYYYNVGVIEHVNTSTYKEGKEVHVFNVLYEQQTNTALFLLPAVIDHTWMQSHLINAYTFIDDELGDFDHPVIHLYYRYDGDKRFYDFEAMVNANQDVLQCLDIDDISMLVTIKYPEHHIRDYYKVLQSKYSEIGLELKSKIYSYYGFEGNTIMHNVLNKSEERRIILENQYWTSIEKGTELWEMFDNEKESFSFESLAKITKTI